MAEPVLIWGAGAIGGILGAYWARAGVPVQMVDIVAEHAVACSTTGLSIEGPVEEFTQTVPCVTPDRLTGTYGRVVLAVKAQATPEAMAQLLPHLAPDGFVLSAQNGLNERVIAEGGRIYLAKDSYTQPEHFRAMEPRLDTWNAVRRQWDPEQRLKSALSVRVLGDPA